MTDSKLYVASGLNKVSKTMVLQYTSPRLAYYWLLAKICTNQLLPCDTHSDQTHLQLPSPPHPD